MSTKLLRGMLLVALLFPLFCFGGCGLAHGVLVKSVALDSCRVPPGGKRLETDSLWTVMWNQKTFRAKVSSPMGVTKTWNFYTKYLLAQGWKTETDSSPSPDQDDSFISVHRGSAWTDFIRWDYQSLDVRITPTDDGKCIVEFYGQFEYAPLTWPRYLVQQGLEIVMLPLLPLAPWFSNDEELTPVGHVIFDPFSSAMVILF